MESSQKHGIAVMLCAVMLGAAAVTSPVRPGTDEKLAIAGVPSPPVCLFNGLTGIPCPGCGLTRSWVSAVHGDLAGSLAHHPLGWLILAYALAQGGRHGAWLALPARRGTVERLGAHLDRGIIPLAALLFLAWIPRLLGVLSA